MLQSPLIILNSLAGHLFLTVQKKKKKVNVLAPKEIFAPKEISHNCS